MIYAGIVAGGTGTRMGADMPKQFLDLCGKPIIIHTIEKFIKIKAIDRIYVGVHPEWIEHCKDLIAKFDLDKKRISILPGGHDRNSTVFNIIEKINSDNKLTNDDIIITHDGVRPFVTEQIILDNISMLKTHDACGTYISAVDTIINSADGKTVTAVPPRNEMYQAQTPQSFKALKLLDVYNSLNDTEKAQLTDTCSIFTIKGLPVHIVNGNSINIKITTAKDLELAKFIAELDS